MFGFYRHFIPNYAQTALPLTELTKRENAFIWTTECDTALKKLKDAMSSAAVLRIFDPSLPTFLVTDASDFAIGAVLE